MSSTCSGATRSLDVGKGQTLPGELLSHRARSCMFGNPSQTRYEAWKGWVVGSYIHAWLPEQPSESRPGNGQVWRDHPVLLVEIRKEQEEREVQFIVAHLYNRPAAAQHTKKLPQFSRWAASISLFAWPRECMYVISNHLEAVYEWDLRVWFRSTSPSVATHLIFNVHTNRLAACDTSRGTGIGRALSTKVSFRFFLGLPREVRDLIYGYTLLDERQMTTRSRIYTRYLLSKREYRKKGWQWHCDPSLPALGPLPTLHTPCILRACKQVRCEALEALYREKTMVLTITSAETGFYDLSQGLLPSLSRFLRIRVDLIVTASAVAGEIHTCFHRIANLLLHQAPSLRFLEVRIGYSDMSISAAVHDRNLVLELSRGNITRCMFELKPLVQKQEEATGRGSKPLQITWGVSETQKRNGDYSCECIYLNTSFLKQIWNNMCNGTAQDRHEADEPLCLEDCRLLGCRFHCSSIA
jgi:hypothetical protein